MANTQKTAIVTGASQGIGAGLVEAYLKRGYKVVANSRNITKTNPFPASPNLAIVAGDIGEPKTAPNIVETTVSRFGRIDVLVNNAGIFIPKPFTEYTTQDFNSLVSIMLAGCCKTSSAKTKTPVAWSLASPAFRSARPSSWNSFSKWPPGAAPGRRDPQHEVSHAPGAGGFFDAPIVSTAGPYLRKGPRKG